MSFLSFETFVAMMLGALYGALFGSLPGLTATLAISLFIPIAIFLEPSVAFSAIIGITATAIFAGDIGATAMRIPGTPTSAAYADEIHQIGKERSPAYALGISALSSALGSLIGVIILIGGSLGLAQIAKQFSSFEYFWLVLLGIVSGVFATPYMAKGLIAFGLGMLIATIGYDPALGTPRFNFGTPNLLGGISFIVALIAFFGVAEVLNNIYSFYNKKNLQPVANHNQNRSVAREFFAEGGRLVFNERRLLFRSSLLGTFIGFLPGAGSDLAAWISSNFTRLRRGSKEQVTLSGASSKRLS